ncbi:MAG: histone deacetylase family protein [Burkholderiaceae bacterium]
MKAVYDPAQIAHDPKFFLVRGVPQASAEQPERAERLLAGLSSIGLRPEQPEDFGPGPRAMVHTPDYLRFLEHGWAQWQALPGASREIVPNTHPVRYAGTYPEGVLGRSGWHMADTACPIGEHTFAAACASANSAVGAAQWVLDGEPHAYALCRPPGHHAYADMAGGFCYLNNTAIVAELLRGRYPRVAILDVDVHHGNGTQGIFWRRRDVLTISSHCDPNVIYPFHYGHAGERAEGDGLGYNYNSSAAGWSGDEALLAAVDKAGGIIRAFAPGALVVALGLDTSGGRPAARHDGDDARLCAWLGEAIARLGLPTVYVQEGGYLSPSLGANLASFLTGGQVTHTLPELGASQLPAGVRARHRQRQRPADARARERLRDAGSPVCAAVAMLSELGYSWRKILPALAAAGYHAIAPDQRGYGRTTGWESDYDADLAPFRMFNLVRDAMGLLWAMGYQRPTP